MITRHEFADFIRHVADGSHSTAEWQRLAVAHYDDEHLESVRRELVRSTIERDSSPELHQLKHFQQHLRELASTL
jgi:hypothetical protein